MNSTKHILLSADPSHPFSQRIISNVPFRVSFYFHNTISIRDESTDKFISWNPIDYEISNQFDSVYAKVLLFGYKATLTRGINIFWMS